MRLTKKSKYAARAMVEIALSGRGTPIRVAEIAPVRAYRSVISNKSSGSCGGILTRRRGAHGEYCLAIPAEEVTVLDIVEILDGEVRPGIRREAATTQMIRRRARREGLG